jgi:hypothetical protein
MSQVITVNEGEKPGLPKSWQQSYERIGDEGDVIHLAPVKGVLRRM